MNLLSLPKYCIISILLELGIGEIGKMMRVCKKLKEIFEIESIWEKFTKKDFMNNIYMDRDLFNSWKEVYKYQFIVFFFYFFIFF